MDVGNLKINLSASTSSFQNSMKEVNSYIRAVNSEFALAKSTLKSYGTETDSLKLKKKQLSDTLEAQTIKVQKIREQLDKSRESTGDNSKATQELYTQYNYAKSKMNDLESQLKTTTQQIDLQENSWYKLSESSKTLGNNLKDVGSKLSDVGKNLTLKVTAPIVALGTAAGKVAIDWESSFAGVVKTVDATESELADLEKGLINMSKELPTTATEIAAVAESAGQLGIETKNIEKFTKVIIDLGNATNLTGEEGASQLAKFANITKMSQENFDRLGSTIVALGNNSATTEADIVSMSMRLAGAGSQVGMTEAQILGLSAALSSVGIESEAGGSAFSKVLVEMQLAVETGSEKLNDFSSIAGMTTTEFARAFKEDASGALVSFIKGLGSTEERGVSAIAVLDDMGISEVRLRDALLRTSSASDLFNSTIQLGTDAWNENTALTKEAEQRYETTASQIEIAKNKLVALGIQIGEHLIPIVIKMVDGISGAIDKFSNMSEGTQKTILVVAGLVAGIGPLLLVVGKIISLVGTASLVFSTVSGAIAVVTTGVAAATPAIGGLAAVFTFITGPIGIAIGVIAALVAGGVLLYKNWDVIKEKAGQLGSWVTDKFNSMKTGVTSALNGVKSFVSNLRLPEIKIPKIKLPHFSLSGEFSLVPPKVPKMSVDWYSTGAIFTKPTVLGGIGIGDAYRGTGSNAEAVLPLNVLWEELNKNFKQLENSMNKNGITQTITINSKNSLSPSEIARENKRALRELGFSY